MSIKEAYAYLFYKLYRFSEAAPSRWWSEWKSYLAMIALEIWLCTSIFGYVMIITKKNLLPESPLKSFWFIFFILIVVFSKYYLFERNESWKKYVEYFDSWPRRKNIIGGIVVWIIILAIIINLIMMFGIAYKAINV